MSAALLVSLMEYWLWAGAAVAVLFLFFGIDRIDEDARGAYVFRPLLIPGVMMIWPLVLWRWAVLESGAEMPQRRYRPIRGAHFTAAVLMAVAIVLALGLGLAVRQSWPADIAPERLEAPA